MAEKTNNEKSNKQKKKIHDLESLIEAQKSQIHALNDQYLASANNTAIYKSQRDTLQAQMLKDRLLFDDQDKHIAQLSESLQTETKSTNRLTQQLAEGITFLKETKQQLESANELDKSQKKRI